MSPENEETTESTEETESTESTETEDTTESTESTESTETTEETTESTEQVETTEQKYTFKDIKFEALNDDEEIDPKQFINEMKAKDFMASVVNTAASEIQGFKPTEVINKLNEIGYNFDPENFGHMVEVAHKVVEYDAMKTNFDAKVKEAVAVELKRVSQKKDAGTLAGDKGKGRKGDGGKGDWSGDEIEAAKRNMSEESWNALDDRY